MGKTAAAIRTAAWLLLAAPAAAQAPGPREIHQALDRLRVDRAQVYYVRELNLRRDVIRLGFSEGKLAFLAAYDGRVTGAVFTGTGRALAVPRDPVEKGSLAHYLGTPLLDLEFTRAYLRFTDGTAEELRGRILAAGLVPIDDPSFADEWDLTVANLNPAHSLRILADELSAEPQPYFYAGLVGPAMGAFDILLDPRRDEDVLIGQPVLGRAQRQYDLWASFRAAGTPPKRAAPFSPTAYALATTIHPDLTLEGAATLHLTARRAGERMVPLELSRSLNVLEVSDAAGQPLVFFQNEESKGSGQRGNDGLWVVLGEAPGAGAGVTLRFRYRGSVISDAGNNVFFVGERGSWYPHVAALDEFATFDLTFRWPRRLRLAATGRRVEEREEGEWRIGRWRAQTPIPVAGFNLGEYVSEAVDAGAFRLDLHANRQLEQALVNRFQRSTSNVTAMRPPPIWPRAPAEVPPRAPMILPAPPPPSPGALLKELGQEVLDSIRFYEKLVGTFPFEQLAVSPIPGGFGQGWPGLLYLSTLSFLPAEAHRRVGLTERTQEQFVELMPFHEVAHQWWGSVVGSRSYRDQWIHEGLASYLALLYAESKRPGQKPLQTWLERFRSDLVAKVPGEEGIGADAGPLVLGTRLRGARLPGAYENVIYGKGPWVFHMLRMLLRDANAKNPDARFFQLLQSLFAAYRQRALTTADLQRAVEERMTAAMDLEGNKRMDWFFDQWVHGTGIPRYRVTFEVKPHPQGFLVRGTLSQREVPESFLVPVPLYAGRSGARPALLGVVVTGGAETPFQFLTRARPRRLLVDPHLTLLCVVEQK